MGEEPVWAWGGGWLGAWVTLDIIAMRCMARGRCERGFGGAGSSVLPCACPVVTSGDGEQGGVG